MANVIFDMLISDLIKVTNVATTPHLNFIQSYQLSILLGDLLCIVQFPQLFNHQTIKNQRNAQYFSYSLTETLNENLKV